ncbi:Protein arginine N-methyltransferase 3 [Dimargaris xerosporica]|nr:Protein arginine N-methyltransferase 3 [Dimargaris xerosporica]
MADPRLSTSSADSETELVTGERHTLQAAVARGLESRRAHTIVLILVLLDLVITLIEIGLSLYGLDDQVEYELWFQVLKVMAWAILSAFIVEFVVKLLGRERELASLIIIFRLWRIVRVMDSVAMSVKLSADAKYKRLQADYKKLQRQVTQLKGENKDLRVQIYQLKAANQSHTVTAKVSPGDTLAERRITIDVEPRP